MAGLNTRRTPIRMLVVLFAMLLASVGLALTSPSKASAVPSGDCSFSRSKFNQGWSTNFGNGNGGTLSYRTYADLYFWDRCDHGWVTGTVAVFGRNLDNNDGTWQTRFQYRADDQSTYRSSDLVFTKYYEESGWTYYYVTTLDYVDFSGGNGYFRSYKVPLRTIFDQDIKSTKVVTGSRSGSSWNLDAGNGTF